MIKLELKDGSIKEVESGMSILEIAKNISEEYNVAPKKTASLLDTCSCIMQGIIPYGAQLLVAANIAKIASFNLIPYLIYPFILLIFVLISIIKEK